MVYNLKNLEWSIFPPFTQKNNTIFHQNPCSQGLSSLQPREAETRDPGSEVGMQSKLVIAYTTHM